MVRRYGGYESYDASLQHLLSGRCVDLYETKVLMPDLRAHGGKDLVPQLIPKIMWNNMQITSVYPDRDYTIEFYTDDGWGGARNPGKRVTEITEPGRYRAKLIGRSSRLTGRMSTLFTIKPSLFKPCLIAVLVLLLVIATLIVAFLIVS